MNYTQTKDLCVSNEKIKKNIKMKELPESTKNYYAEKASKITQIYAKKLSDNFDDYEGFINVPFTKSMIRLKFDVDLDYKTSYGRKTSMTEEDVFEMMVDESLSSLIYSGIEKQKPNRELDIFLTNQMPKTSTDNVIEFLDSALKKQNINKMQQEIDKIRFMYIGDVHIPLIPHILEQIDTLDWNGYIGEYEGIKIFYVEQLTDIYITSAPYIDLTTIDVRYNEYIKKKYDKLYNPEKCYYEEIERKQKNAVITLNCNLGDVKILKLRTIYGTGKTFMRKLKLQRILKNEIDI